jgi:ABC-type glycerol-3-phosphate transport system permease component
VVRKKFTVFTAANLLLLILITATMVFPMYFLTVSAFKVNTEYMVNLFGLPKKLTLINFESLFERYDIVRMTLNTIIVTIGAVCLSTVVNTMAGFIFSKLPYRGSDRIFSVIVACMAVPAVVLMIPVYLFMVKVKLINNYLSLILFYGAMTMPFSLYLVTSNIKLIPNDFFESATIDGAGIFRLYLDIAVPLARPAILTMMSLNFLAYWNELLFAMLLLQTNKLRTLTVGAATAIGTYTSNMPLVMTGLLMNSVPVLAFFIFANRYLVKGLTAGAIK